MTTNTSRPPLRQLAQLPRPSTLALGFVLLPPALAQEVHLAPARGAAPAELRLTAAEPGARAVLLDRTTREGEARPDGLPAGRVAAVRTVDVRGEARFALDAGAFDVEAPLAVIVAGSGGLALAGAVTLPSAQPFVPRTFAGQTRQVLVTEFMKDPVAVSDTRGEWIELYNPSHVPIDVEGWVLSDNGTDSTVLNNGGAGIVLPGLGFAVLARNGDPLQNGGVLATATYSGFTLGNGADQIILSQPNGIVSDEVLYLDGPAWPDDPGATVSLSPRAWFTRHDDLASAWCPGESVMAMGDLGTPGSFNDTCWD